MNQKNRNNLNGSALRDERLQQLMDSCQQEVLRQIIGPFGLTPAMFNDKDGGNVTTQHNAKQGLFAKDSEEYNRADYDYSAAKREIMREAVKNGTMNSQEFVDQYTGNREPTKRENNNGKLVMNAELDHLEPVIEIHVQGGWMKDKEGRTELSSTKDNLHYTTHKTNRSKNAKRPEVALSAENGFDQNRIGPLSAKAREAIDQKLPSTTERAKYHGKELLSTGAQEAGRNALRQAFGVLLHAFVNGSFIELKKVFNEHRDEKSLIDRIIESLNRVMQRVIKKLKNTLDALIEGGVQGFISNLLTFLINNLITTSKKVVTLIRESTQNLWRAIKLLANPPVDMSAVEVAREVSKIIATIVTTGIGMLLQESAKGFITSIPVLIPIADVLATAMTAIMTGITTALIIYAIDRIFDWISSTGTELLQALEANAESQVEVVERMQTCLQVQFQSSRLYDSAVTEYHRICQSYSNASFQMQTVCVETEITIDSRNEMIEIFEKQIERKKKLDNLLKYL